MWSVAIVVQEELYERMAKAETKLDEHGKLLSAQIEKNEALTRLTTLVELQMQDSKERERRQEIRDEKQNKQMEKFSDTLVKVNQNLDNLNSKQELLDERVTGIEGTLSHQKIDVVGLVKSILTYALTAAGGIVVAYLYMKLGLK
jgi:predicted nuclease with TOPRIM domain